MTAPGDDMVANGYGYYRDMFGRVFVEVQSAMVDCRFRIRAADSATGAIHGSTGISTNSWGELIDVAVGISPGGTLVSIRSRPKLNDGGLDSMNIQRFFAALDRRLPDSRLQAAPQTPLYDPYLDQKFSKRYQANPGYVLETSRPGSTVAIIMALANGLITLIAAWEYTGLVGFGASLGVCLGVNAILLLLGGALIGNRSYRAGAILCLIGGFFTFPLGILGMAAASKALVLQKWRADNPWAS